MLACFTSFDLVVVVVLLLFVLDFEGFSNLHLCFHPQTYLDYFSRALEFEYRDSGITVQCLTPFYVATRMTRYSETLSKTNFFIPTAASFAHSAVKTLGYSSRTTGYFPHTIQVSEVSWCSDLKNQIKCWKLKFHADNHTCLSCEQVCSMNWLNFFGSFNSFFNWSVSRRRVTSLHHTMQICEINLCEIWEA